MFWIYSFILVISTVIFTVTGTLLAKFLLELTAVQDLPNERSNHARPVPRGGGVAIIVPLLGFMLVSGAPSHLLWAALGLAVISFVDDLRGVAIRDRLIIQVAACALALTSLDGLVFQGLLPFWPDRLLAGVLLLGFLNLYNFMDGIDGITGAQTIALGLGFIGMAIAVPHLGHGLGVDGALLIAAAGSFLLFNWHPARIFMGDVGSITLGFITGFLLLQLAALGQFVPALILPAYYLVDAGITFGKRLYAKEKVWEAHSQHAYQQAVRMGWPHDAVVLKIARSNACSLALALIATGGGAWAALALVLAYAQAGWLWWLLKTRRPEAGSRNNDNVIDAEFEEVASPDNRSLVPNH